MLMRDALNHWTPTTIMTGNLTQVTIQLVEMVVAVREPDAQKRARIRKDARVRLIKFGLPLTGFVLGATMSAFLTPRYGFWSVGVPTVVAAALTAWHWRLAWRSTTSSVADGLARAWRGGAAGDVGWGGR
jgi:uncharacterized membrane protein YoaK (UPF0700 family)